MKFSVRTMLFIILLIGMALAIAIQERERRRLNAQFRYAVWRLENAQEFINARRDEDDEWRSMMIKKYGTDVDESEFKQVATAFMTQHQHLRLYLSDAWLLTGWDSQDDENSPNGPPQ